MSDITSQIDAIYQAQLRRVLATLIRLLGDFDRAEEALHDAVRGGARAVAARRRSGSRARGWCRRAASRRSTRCAGARASTPRRRRWPRPSKDQRAATDARRHSRTTDCGWFSPAAIRRCQLDAQVALTLREVCGLTTEEIARAFLTAARTVAQRIVRAKAKIRDARSPIRCRCAPSCPSGSTRCCASSTWCSTRATRHRRAPR
ncbi:MAG: sigma factor-like helix-turn-helix DNA-binding protein [Vicinamibacterales bacterium]